MAAVSFLLLQRLCFLPYLQCGEKSGEIQFVQNWTFYRVSTKLTFVDSLQTNEWVEENGQQLIFFFFEGKIEDAQDSKWSTEPADTARGTNRAGAWTWRPGKVISKLNWLGIVGLIVACSPRPINDFPRIAQTVRNLHVIFIFHLREKIGR